MIFFPVAHFIFTSLEDIIRIHGVITFLLQREYSYDNRTRVLMTASVINIPHLVFLAAGRLEKISKGFSSYSHYLSM